MPPEAEAPDVLLHDLLRRVTRGQETALDVIRKTLGEGPDARERLELVITERAVQAEPPAEPPRWASRPRRHQFSDAEGFADYLHRYGGANTVVLANPKATTIHAVLDETATNGFEIVTMQPQVHPAMSPWALLLDPPMPDSQGSRSRLPLHAFLDFLAINRKAIVEPDGRELALTLGQVRVARNVEIQEGRGRTSLNGVMVETKIAGQTPTREPVDIPDTIAILVPLYVRSKPRRLEVDILLDAPTDSPILVRATCADLALAQVDEFEEMLSLIESRLIDQSGTFALGSPGYDAWEYILDPQEPPIA